jgi:hypothetical protein
MSAWRREALHRLPECRRVIEAAENPMALWIELLDECGGAYKEQNEDLIRRFYDYARWCWQQGSMMSSTRSLARFTSICP